MMAEGASFDEMTAAGFTLADLRAAIAEEGKHVAARKLRFSEQCGAFAALYGGAKPKVVALAFGVTAQTISCLSGCLESDPDPYRYEIDPKSDTATGRKVERDHDRNRSPNRIRHYPNVRREFEALGVEEFNRRYYNDRTVNRIVLAKKQLRDEAHAKKQKIWKNPRDPY
jgi:hypothetical protein